MIGVLAHGEMLALAHDIPDVAEHEQIAGHGAGQARDIVGVSGHEAGREAPCNLRGGICLGDGVVHPPRQIVGHRDVLFPGEFDEAAGEIGIAGGKCRLDMIGDGSAVIPQNRIELEIGQNSRVVLRRQHGGSVPCLRP